MDNGTQRLKNQAKDHVLYCTVLYFIVHSLWERILHFVLFLITFLVLVMIDTSDRYTRFKLNPQLIKIMKETNLPTSLVINKVLLNISSVTVIT